MLFFLFFFFNDTATTEIYTLSLHDALPIYPGRQDADGGEETGPWWELRVEGRLLDEVRCLFTSITHPDWRLLLYECSVMFTAR